MFNKTNGLNQPAADSTKKAVTTPINRTNTMTSPSILAADLVITGDIKTEGDVQIDGRIEGNITAGNITVGEQGAVNGTVIAQSIHVRGLRRRRESQIKSSVPK